MKTKKNSKFNKKKYKKLSIICWFDEEGEYRYIPVEEIDLKKIFPRSYNVYNYNKDIVTLVLFKGIKRK